MTTTMETITNAQRIESLTEIRTQVQNEMDYCTRQIEMPALLRCNCIVATADAEYQITVNNKTHKAEVLIGNYHEPCFFTEKLATKIASEVKASNGFGPLTFIVWGWKSFYKARRDNLQKSLDVFNELIEKFSN